MPIANKYSMDEVLDACRNYFDKTGRRITFEYSLVAGVNDSEEDARQLAGRIKRHQLPCKSDSGQSHQGTLLCEVYSTGCGEFQNKT